MDDPIQDIHKRDDEKKDSADRGIPRPRRVGWPPKTVEDEGLRENPPTYRQGRQEWAQVDGRIRDLYFRSFVAAYGLGATFENTTVPEIEHNIRAASDYTRDLSGPCWEDVFTREEHAINRGRAQRGRTVYEKHCFSCHGAPARDGTGWRKGPRQGEVIPREKIGTDAERVSHRYYKSLPNEINDIMPAYHPFSVPRTGIRPGPMRTLFLSFLTSWRDPIFLIYWRGYKMPRIKIQKSYQ